MELLKVQNLSKIYGQGESQVKALWEVSFSMEKGEFAAVVGESGSGKSTLLHCVGGLDTPTGGKVLLDGEDLFALDEKKRTVFRRRNIGFIFQAFHLIEELNVEQNIAFPLLLDGQKPDQGKMEELLGLLGLFDRRKHLPSQLSGGQKQRVAIGRALIMRPMLILADEPTGNLDSKTTREILSLMQKIVREQNQTLVMVTHDNYLAGFADRIFHIKDGKIIKIEEGRGDAPVMADENMGGLSDEKN